MLATLARLAQQADEAAKQAADKAWAGWVLASEAAGAGGLHKFTKVAPPWVSAAVVRDDGSSSNHPAHILEDEKKKWEKAWATHSEPPPHLPSLSPAPRHHHSRDGQAGVQHLPQVGRTNSGWLPPQTLRSAAGGRPSLHLCAALVLRASFDVADITSIRDLDPP